MYELLSFMRILHTVYRENFRGESCRPLNLYTASSNIPAKHYATDSWVEADDVLQQTQDLGLALQGITYFIGKKSLIIIQLIVILSFFCPSDSSPTLNN